MSQVETSKPTPLEQNDTDATFLQNWLRFFPVSWAIHQSILKGYQNSEKLKATGELSDKMEDEEMRREFALVCLLIPSLIVLGPAQLPLKATLELGKKILKLLDRYEIEIQS